MLSKGTFLYHGAVLPDGSNLIAGPTKDAAISKNTPISSQPHQPLKETSLRWLALLAAAIPFALALSLIASFGVNIPFLDEWDMLYLFDRLDSGKLSWNDIWIQHNEHRLVFPKIILLLFGMISGHNLRVLMFFSLALAALLFFLLMRHTARNAGPAGIGRSVYLLWVMYSVFLFSPVQRQNWLWGFQFQWFLNLLAVAAGGYIFANARPSHTAVAGLAACGAVATFSLSSGMLYWVVLLGFMIAGRPFGVSKFTFGQIGVLVAAFVGIFALYLVGYEKPSAHPSLLVFISAPADFLLYVAVYTGGPMALGGTVGEAALWGALGILLFLFLAAVLIRNADAAQLRFSTLFMILGSYSLLSAVLTAVGRAGMGPGQALASRYTSVAILLWISVVSLMVLSPVATQTGSGLLKRLKIFIIVAFFGIFTANSLLTIGSYPRVYRSRMCGMASVLQPSHPECLVQLYPDPRRLRETDVPTLKRLKLSVFAEPVPGKN